MPRRRDFRGAIEALKHTRLALEQQQAQATDTAARLNVARAELDELLAQKEKEAASAAQSYGTLKAQMEKVAREAADFQALLSRVRALRQEAGAAQSVVTVTAQNSGLPGY
jgi:chromosome segregation ATPase